MTQTAPAPLKLSRTLHAPPETVFAAWTSGDHLARWFAPAPYTVPEARVEPRAGGAFDVCMASPAGERHWTRGTIVEFVPARRLVIEMRVTDAAGRPLFRARTELDFAEALGGTRLDVTQAYVFDDPAAAAPMVAGARAGWTRTLEQLDQALAAGTGAPPAARSVAHAAFHLERAYDVPPARLWAALTEAEAKQKWFAGTPGEWTLIERSMDVRPGGRERLKGRWASGLVTTFDAVYHDVVPAERLVYSYEMRLDKRKISVSLATMQLRADGGRTTLLVTEQGAFLDGYDDAGSRERGTAQLLEAIAASLGN